MVAKKPTPVVPDRQQRTTAQPTEPELGPSDLGPPADAQKTDDGYVYPDSGSFVVEAHKGTKTEPAPAPQQHPPGKRRG